MIAEKPAGKAVMGSDLMSEIVLLGGTGAIIITLLLLFLAAFARAS